MVVWIVESLTDYVAQILWRNLAQTIEHEARMDAYRHVQGLELAWFEDQSTGGLLSILNDDVNQLERFLDVGANELIRTLVNVRVRRRGVLRGRADARASWPSPRSRSSCGRRCATSAGSSPTTPRCGQAAGDLGALLANNLSGIATIRSFTAEEREVERVAAASTAYREANRGAIKLSSAFIPLIRMAILAAFTVTLARRRPGRARRRRSPSALFSVLVYMTQRLLWPLTRLGETFDLYQRAMASTRRILDLLAVEPTIVGGHRRAARRRSRGEVRFAGVRFAYGAGRPVLDGFDLAVPAGRDPRHRRRDRRRQVDGGQAAAALLRPAGRADHARRRAGRRRCRCAALRRADRLRRPGRLPVPGHRAREPRLRAAPTPTDAELERAARLAEAHEFIVDLPDGYDTVVGERGQKLSGGQRQRLSIARAILKDPPLLVLDEATSAVDNETEAAIQRSLELVGRGRTVIVIAHRLSTVRHADRIHVLEAGRVVESGTHDELVAARRPVRRAVAHPDRRGPRPARGRTRRRLRLTHCGRARVRERRARPRS